MQLIQPWNTEPENVFTLTYITEEEEIYFGGLYHAQRRTINVNSCWSFKGLLKYQLWISLSQGKHSTA